MKSYKRIFRVSPIFANYSISEECSSVNAPFQYFCSSKSRAFIKSQNRFVWKSRSNFAEQSAFYGLYLFLLFAIFGIQKNCPAAIDLFKQFLFVYLAMEYPQPNIPHRTADGSAGHVARRTEVKAPESTSRSEFRTVLRSKTMNSRPRHSLGASSTSSRNATSVLLNSSCRTCGTTLSDELPMTKKWASSSDIFKAYSDPSTSLSVRRSGPVRTSSVKNFQRITKPGEKFRKNNYRNFDNDQF